MWKGIYGFLKTHLAGTLRRQLIVGVILVHAVLMMLFVWDLTSRQYELLLQRQVEQAKALSHSIATSSAGWLAANDLSGLQEIITAQSRYPELVFAMILDEQGRVIAHTDLSLLGRYVSDLPEQPVSRILSKTPDLVDAVSPVMLADYPIGWVRVGIGQKITAERLSAITRHGIIYALIAILLGALLAWYMAVRMTRKLKKIQECADQIEQGNTDVRTNLTGSDEVSHVGHALDSMLDKLMVSRRELAEREERFNLAMQGANDGIWDWDLKTDEVYYSPRWKGMLGYQDWELENRFDTWKRLVDPEGEAKALKLVEECLSGKSDDYSIEFKMQHKEGRWVHILARATVVRNDQDEPVRMVGTHTDISAQKQAQQLLIDARNEADKANKAKSEFLASMSHELRTPLNAIIGFSDLIGYEEARDLSTLKLHARHINESGVHLLALVDDVLDLARIESGSVHVSLEPVPLQRLLEECFMLIEPMVHEARLQLTFDYHTDYVVQADYTRLKQVLINLLSNAVKYNGEQGNITVELESRDDDRLRIKVTDTGNGLSEVQQHDLFKPFERFDAEYSNVAGTGIGLTIAKQLIELMNGMIGVESSKGKGSTFWVELEKSDRETVHTAQHADGDQAVKEVDAIDKKLVYIEDNRSNVVLMEHVIGEMTDYKLFTAGTGDEGLVIIHEQQPDLVLLDINLPGKSGFDILKELRAHSQTKSIPVVAVTANAMLDDRDKTLDAGFDDYISKPIKVKILLDVIKKLI